MKRPRIARRTGQGDQAIPTQLSFGFVCPQLLRDSASFPSPATMRVMWRRTSHLLLLSSYVACGSGPSSSLGDDAENGASSFSSSSGAPFGSSSGGGAVLGDAGDRCNPNLTGVVRDFRPKSAGGHPDFESYNDGVARGLVAAQLGPDRKPAFASTRGSNGKPLLTGRSEFEQWYRDTDGVNQPFEFVLPLQPAGAVSTYSNAFFFPIDGRGFGNSGTAHDGVEHNFHFTFELHLEFVYRGGETFKFTGDDDLWAFFNGKLGIDLGGVHGAESATFDLDAKAKDFGLTKGGKYALDVFHAERHTGASNFRIDTTLDFVNCDKIVLPK
jgi:fibro-slime domain-containing protein